MSPVRHTNEDGKLSIDPMHLVVTNDYPSGCSLNVHVMRNDDLTVLFARGQETGKAGRGVERAVTGTIVVSLGVDEDHDEIHYECGSGIDGLEALGQAIDTLTLAWNAFKRVDPPARRAAVSA